LPVGPVLFPVTTYTINGIYEISPLWEVRGRETETKYQYNLTRPLNPLYRETMSFPICISL